MATTADPASAAASSSDPERFSVVIVGAGSGGLTAALFAARLGAKACLIERHRVGGDCTWTGCVPSKALLKCAKVAHTARHAAKYGIAGVDGAAVQADMAKVHAYVQNAIQEVFKHETPDVFEGKGIRVFQGTGEFASPHEMRVVAADGSSTTIHGDRFLLCTGARPAVPGFVRDSGVPFLTYETIFDVKELPASMVVIGGGPVGAEIAQAYSRLGTKVTVVCRKLLPKEDDDARAVVRQVFLDEGITLVESGATECRNAAAGDGSIEVIASSGEVVSAQILFVASGRRPSIDSLKLENAGVASTPAGITTNKHLKTNVGHIYAAGDCIGSQQFTHYAGWQAFMAVRNFILPSADDGTNDLVPRVTFVDPEVAAVGLTEDQFRAKYPDGTVDVRELSHVDRAVCEGEQDAGFYKLMYSADHKIRGAVIVCQRAGELINEVAVAMERGLTLKQLGKTIHAYPSFGFGLQQMASDVAVESLFHGLTGRLIGLLKRV